MAAAMPGAVVAGVAAPSQALPRLDAVLRTPEDILDWLSNHARHDPEVAHVFVDEVLLATPRSIRDGHEDPAGLARAVLTVAETNFPRWFA